MKVSVLLLTFNEMGNLARCLDALLWCDDIIAVDSGSTDGSIAFMRLRGVRVVSRAFDDFASQRNFGVAEGLPRHDWVLHLDADEVVTEAFVRALVALEPSEFDAYHVPSKLMLYDRWLRHAGMYPVYQVRLGHRDRLRFRQVGHGQREDLPPDRVGVFHEPYLHYNFSHGLGAWLRKHIRYAEDEARLIVEGKALSGSHGAGAGAIGRRRLLKRIGERLPLLLRPFARAIYMIIVKRAFLDGRAGWLYVGMLCVYEAMISLFVFEERVRRACAGHREA